MLQYISDNKGKTTGVFIPIKEWYKIEKKIDSSTLEEIPNWQKDEVRARLVDFKNNPTQSYDFNSSMDEIEKNL